MKKEITNDDDACGDEEMKEFLQYTPREAKIIWRNKEVKQFLIAGLILMLFFMWMLRDKSPDKNIDHNYRQCNGGLCEYGSYDEMIGWSE